MVDGNQRLRDKPTIDDELFKSISLEYSVYNKKIYSGNGCNGHTNYRGVSLGRLHLIFNPSLFRQLFHEYIYLLG